MRRGGTLEFVWVRLTLLRHKLSCLWRYHVIGRHAEGFYCIWCHKSAQAGKQ